MLDFIGVLMKVLMLEGALLLGISLVSIVLLLKQMKDKGISKKTVGNMLVEFKENLYLEEKKSNIYKGTIVIYGVTKLTALWCFSILFGVLVTSNMWVVVGILVLEVLIIALEVRNRFIVDREDIINASWVVAKVEGVVQKKNPEFSIKGAFEKNKNNVQKYIGKNKNTK